MTEQMIATVTERVNTMMQDSKIAEMVSKFSTPEAAQEYLIKAAIATLIIPVNER